MAHGYVTQADVDQNAQRAINNTQGIAASRPPLGPCTPAMIGTPEWLGAWDHSTSDSNWNARYRDIKGNISAGVNSIQPLVAEMWKAYRGD